MAGKTSTDVSAPNGTKAFRLFPCAKFGLFLSNCQWWRTLALSQLPEQEKLVPTAPPGQRWSALVSTSAMETDRRLSSRNARTTRLMMALTPKRLFLSLCISISLLRPYTFFSRSPLVFKTVFENACELQ